MRPGSTILIILTLVLLAAPATAQSDPADAAWRAGDTRRAAALYEMRVSADSSDVVALQRLALLRAWAGQHAEALRLADRRLALEPGSLEGRLDRARILALAGRLDDAQRSYDQILAQQPGEIGALVGSARVLAWRGDLAAAESQWRSILERAPDNGEALVGLAQTLRWQGRDAAAAPLLERVLAAEPDNTDAREQLEWVNVALRPRVTPRIVHERDSDGNRVTSLSAGAGGRVRARTELRADGYARAARVRSQPAADALGYGGSLTLWQQLESGWHGSGTVGVASSDVETAEVLPVLGISLATPARHRAVLQLTATHAPFDATSLLLQRRVVVSELAGTVASTHARPATLSAHASVARFEGRASGLHNTRVAGGVAAELPAGPLRLVARARAFGFERDDIFDGYFAPDLYVLAETAAQYTRTEGRVNWLVEAAPGLQKITSEGALKASFRGTGELSWVPRPGRSIALGASYASAGVNALSPGAASSYRYRSLWLAARWGL